MRVLELFCGIGGCAAALAGRAEIVAAVDQSRQALAAYAHNFAHPVAPRVVESLSTAELLAWRADLWWMSPPCPPYTTRGARRDLDDSRARSFVALLDRIAEVRPAHLAFENVPGFAGSRAHARLLETLDAAGYESRETLLCPTELGIPNRRRRFYLVASREGLLAWPPRDDVPREPLARFLDTKPANDLWCDPAIAQRYTGALNIVDADDPRACTSCFTSAYGRSFVRSGSYLATPGGLRRFSPAEILRLLGFPASYSLLPEMTTMLGWRLVGNSVSVRAVRWVLNAFRELGNDPVRP